jgi:hypothetical protein
VRDVSFWPTAKDLAERFGVHITTARRWVRERNAPPAVMMLLTGDLGVFDMAWEGWCVRGEALYSPEGLEVAMGDVRSVPYTKMLVQSYQLDARLAKLPQFEDQPTPEQWADDLNYG